MKTLLIALSFFPVMAFANVTSEFSAALDVLRIQISGQDAIDLKNALRENVPFSIFENPKLAQIDCASFAEACEITMHEAFTPYGGTELDRDLGGRVCVGFQNFVLNDIFPKFNVPEFVGRPSGRSLSRIFVSSDRKLKILGLRDRYGDPTGPALYSFGMIFRRDLRLSFECPGFPENN